MQTHALIAEQWDFFLHNKVTKSMDVLKGVYRFWIIRRLWIYFTFSHFHLISFILSKRNFKKAVIPNMNSRFIYS